MRRIYCTFSGAAYDGTTRRIVENAPLLGQVSDVWVYDDLWLMGTPFYAQHTNRWLWEHPGDERGNKRGFGWFAWKPLIIMDALSRMDPGEVLLYTDADTYPVRPFGMLYDECKRVGGAMLFEAQGCVNWQWVKRDCFLVMSQDDDIYRNGQHPAARFMLFEAGNWHVQQFLMEWLTYCVNPTATTFDANRLGQPDHAKFVQHRTEQAIMGLLAMKYHYPMYREACQFGETGTKDRGLYPEQLFFQGSRAVINSLEGSKYRNMDHRGFAQ